jgi:hypothetical protein
MLVQGEPLLTEAQEVSRMRMRSVIKHSTQAVLEGALISLLVVGLVAGTSLAAKGGKSGGGHNKTTGTGTLAVVMVDDANGNGSPNYHDTITFDVTSSLSSPYVDLTCTQNGTLVYSASAGFYADFPWPGAQNMPLYSPSWTGGAADCVAVLENTTTKLSFHVDA